MLYAAVCDAYLTAVCDAYLTAACDTVCTCCIVHNAFLKLFSDKVRYVLSIYKYYYIISFEWFI